MTSLTLPLQFDLGRLRADLASVAPADWSAHYNRDDFGGHWRGAALRSSSGASTELAAVAAAFHDTPLLGRCSYFREVLAAFDCPLKSVRLLRLEPGSFIREHSDHALDFEDGEVRIHIPIQTNPGVEFYLSGERLNLAEGGAYYVNVNLPHRVNNRGDTPRIHLVLDAEVNGWLADLFARSSEIPRIDPPPRGVLAFRDAAAVDPALAEPLRAFDETEPFIAAAVRIARASGFDVHENDVDALVRGVPRPGSAAGLPCSVVRFDPEPVLQWIDAGAQSLDDPFFDDTVRASLRKPYARFSRRLAPLPTVPNPVPPAGLIFHVSRCGSTLAARLLRGAGFRVVSEAPPVDSVLQAGRADWLRALVHILAAGQPCILKLDAWHVHALPLLREAFPQTPWIFLFRDPVEVLASHARAPGLHALPGALDPRIVGMTTDDITAVPRDQWPARVVARICDSALRHTADPLGRFVDYNSLPDAIWSLVAPHFGIRACPAEIDRMREAARFDAKRPGAEFTRTPICREPFTTIARENGLDRLYDELRAHA